MSILSLLSILTTTTVYAQKDANNENIKLTNETVFDIAIVNGTVIDPETMLDDIKNVGIINGKIASITNKPIKGNQNIDATGLIVSPGFIDMHFHSIDPFGTKLGILDGVTTGGDLEAGALDVDKFYKDKENKSKMNYMTTVAHAFARMKVLDNYTAQDARNITDAYNTLGAMNHSYWVTKIPTAGEHKAILEILDKGLKEGAVGIGSLLGYMPSGVNAREMFEVQKLAGNYDRITDVHTRFSSTIPPTEYVLGGHEILANALVLNAPVIFAHLNNMEWDLGAEMFNLARERGLNAWGEYYPYESGSTFVGADFLDPEKMKEYGFTPNDIMDPATGKRLTEKELVDLRKNDPGHVIILFKTPAEFIVEWIKSPSLILGGDGMMGVDKHGKYLSENSPFEEFAGHPRTAGSHGKVLKLARDNDIPLMHVINQMSYLPSKYLGETGLKAMDERGRMQEGKIADIVIFDPKTVTDRSTYFEGENGLPTTGIPYVIVNGKFVVKDSNFIQDSNPGQPIRFPIQDNNNLH